MYSPWEKVEVKSHYSSCLAFCLTADNHSGFLVLGSNDARKEPGEVYLDPSEIDRVGHIIRKFPGGKEYPDGKDRKLYFAPV